MCFDVRDRALFPHSVAEIPQQALKNIQLKNTPPLHIHESCADRTQLEHTPPLHIHRARAALRSAVPPRRTLVRAASAGICAAPFVLALALALALLAAALDAVGEEARASADVDKGQAAVGRADGNVESELRLQTASPVRRNDHHC